MDHIHWGLLIVSYLFLGGISAGLFFISGLATYLQETGSPIYPRIARVGAMLAPWPISLGSLLLVFDLGRWYRFYKLFTTFTWHSPMSIGAWFLLLFTVVALAYFWAWLPGDLVARAAASVPRRLRFLRILDWPGREGLRRRLAAVGFPLSLGVGIYTGVLLGAVQSRPFWNTNLVAQIFLFSALSTGCATAILALCLGGTALDSRGARLLYGVDISLILLEFFLVVPYVIHGELSPLAAQQALRLILGGPFTFAFWGLFVGLGLLAPLLLELWEIRPLLLDRGEFHASRILAAVTALLVIFGGFVLRYVFVFAGQMTSFE